MLIFICFWGGIMFPDDRLMFPDGLGSWIDLRDLIGPNEEERHIDDMISSKEYNFSDIKKYLKTHNKGELYYYAIGELRANQKEGDAEKLLKKIKVYEKSRTAKQRTGGRTTVEKTEQLSPVKPRSTDDIPNDQNIRRLLYKLILIYSWKRNETIKKSILEELQLILSSKLMGSTNVPDHGYLSLDDLKLILALAPGQEKELAQQAEQLLRNSAEGRDVLNPMRPSSVAPLSQNKPARVPSKTTREFAAEMLGDTSKTALKEFAAAITSRHLNLFQGLSLIDFLKLDAIYDPSPEAIEPLLSAAQHLREEILSTILSASVVKFSRDRKDVDQLIDRYLDLAGLLYQQGDFLGADAVYSAVYGVIMTHVEQRRGFTHGAIDSEKLQSAKRNAEFLKNLSNNSRMNSEILDSLASDGRMLIPLVGFYTEKFSKYQFEVHMYQLLHVRVWEDSAKLSLYLRSLEKCIEKCKQKDISSPYQLVDDNAVIRVGNDPNALHRVLQIAVPFSIQECEKELEEAIGLQSCMVDGKLKLGYMALALEPGYREWAEKCLYALSWEYSPHEIISALSEEVDVINRNAAAILSGAPGNEQQLEELAKKMELAFEYLKSLAGSHLMLPSEWTPQTEGLVHDTIKKIVGGSDNAAAVLTQEMKTLCSESISLVSNRNATGRVDFADQMKAILSKSRSGDVDGVNSDLSALAEAMTFEEARLFEAIGPREFDRAKFHEAAQAPNYSKFTRHWNQRNNEIAISIVGDTVIPFGSLSDRTHLVSVYIRLAKELWKQGNLSGAFGIIMILNNGYVSKTMKKADPVRAAELETQISDLTQTFNPARGGMALRELEKPFLAQNEPCIPAISAYTGIITSAGDVQRKSKAGEMVWKPFTLLGEQLKHLSDLTANVRNYSSKFTVNYFLEDLGNRYTSEKELEDAFKLFILNLPQEVSVGDYREAVAVLELNIRTFVAEAVKEEQYRADRAVLRSKEGDKQASLDKWIARSVEKQAEAKQAMDALIPSLSTQRCSDNALMDHYAQLSRDAAHLSACQDILRDCTEWRDSHRTLAELQRGILSANTTLASLAKRDPANAEVYQDLAKIISTFAMECSRAAPFLGSYYKKKEDKYELNRAAALIEASPEVKNAVLMLMETCKSLQRQLDAFKFRDSTPENFGQPGAMGVAYMKANVAKTLRNLGDLSSLISG